MSKSGPTRRTLLASSLTVLPMARVHAADPAPRVVAVLSLIGDALSLVVRRMTTGSNVDRNEQQTMAIDDPVFDVAAAEAAERAVKEAVPAAERLRVSIRDKRLYALQDGVLEPGNASDGMRLALQSLLLKEKATHLLLVTKRRDDAVFKLAASTTGSGKVSGMGIYIDNSIGLRDTASTVVATGYFACYAYVKATLVEVSTMRSLGASKGTDSVITTSLGEDAIRAWDALSAKGKADNLVRVADRAVFDAARQVASLL